MYSCFKFVIIAGLLLITTTSTLVNAAPKKSRQDFIIIDQQPPTPIITENKIIRYEVKQTETGHKFLYELQDGQFREEEVLILNKGTDDEEIVVIGSYSFWGTDGLLYLTRYTADRNGYAANTTKQTRAQHDEISLINDAKPASSSLIGTVAAAATPSDLNNNNQLIGFGGSGSNSFSAPSSYSY